ncbi:UDP-N-acetylmuramoyl-L-alanine--D-glutamate ligase [Algicella marina]|uniref:UDP-N-acetylmuramoylalanine--D-glutamate ligase n=1 Tax=Algicella marina TaxID=2683284 RepID=A0A6P1SWA2_9RHOB|nr:UDP-N-acetylmuramoyl-L-alanine--D-glutamate ligase [Algicella marina]QHQ34047.1 UDP-N-acetylmuramoyl-L-alanine--D-glutamate ligase [Algicella marina]
MIPVRGYEGHRVAVLGLGRSGLVAARALRAGGAEVVAWDDNPEARAAAEAEGFTPVDLSRDAAWEDVRTLILSPGIPALYPAPNPIVEKAWTHGAVVDNDIGLFFRSYATEDWGLMDRPPRVICVTGSNGKSTTTALIHHCLKAIGMPAQMAGNIGRGVLDLEPGVDGEVVVLELSSYQTEVARALAPDIAIFMNLTPDHLDRHGGMGGYFAAKRRLFAEGGPERAIIGVDEAEGRYLAAEMRQEAEGGDPVIRISSAQKLVGGWNVFARKGFLSEWRKGRQVASIDLREMAGLPGAHNHQNACAAYAALRSLGVAPKKIEVALASYPGLPHRCQLIGEKGGVRFVNDSKATNADAAEKALLAFPRVRWILGGRAKDGGIAALAPLFDRVAKAYLIGEAAESFGATLGTVPQETCGDMATAVSRAAAEAEPGEVVLLAPAAASFDQYSSFETRGDDFVAAVQRVLAAG